MRLKIVAAAIAAIGLFLGISYINFASTEAANKHAAANAAFRPH